MTRIVSKNGNFIFFFFSGRKGCAHHPIEYFRSDPRATFRFFRCDNTLTRSLVIANTQIHVRWEKACVFGSRQTTNKERELERIPKSRDKKCLFFFPFFPLFFFTSLRHSIKRTSAVVKLTLALLRFQS